MHNSLLKAQFVFSTSDSSGNLDLKTQVSGSEYSSLNESVLRKCASLLQSAGYYEINEQDDLTAIADILPEAVAHLVKISGSINEKLLQSQEQIRQLEQFACITAHDLKAPLRAISNLTTWIQEDSEGKLSAESEKSFELLRKRISIMDQMIQGILNYSRDNYSGENMKLTDTGKLIDDITGCTSCSPDIKITTCNHFPVLECDVIRLQQVLSNLISNAVQSIQGKGEVHISFRMMNNIPEFTITDTGKGIADDQQHLIFNKYNNADATANRDSGLGLSIVKKLVENQGGTLVLSSVPGSGSRFSFTWPSKIINYQN